MPGLTSVNNSAGRKRRRGGHDRSLDNVGDEDGDEVVDVRSASSGLRLDSRKRIRVSDSGVITDPCSSIRDATPATESANETAVDEDEASTSFPSATQYEVLRDDGFRHLQNEDEDDQRATQKLRYRPRQIGDNHAAENGILESITCVNFMCHERLHCDLGPLLNFIVGENGSGKSAILTAITLCLGGKASSTNRGGSLKSFVKEGRDQAVLTVKIKNHGIDAYRNDIFGDSIIVERHFTKGGSSGFKVKSALGRIISTKRQVVEEIVEYYCLQVDNPLNVLSQDNARQFLNAASAATKYKFFIQGVQLEQLDNDYRVVQESAELVESRVAVHEETVLQTRKGWEAAKKLLEIVSANKDLRRKRRHLANQLAWAQVADQERALEERTRDIATCDQEITEAEQAIQTKSQALGVEDERLKLAEAAAANVKAEEGDLRAGVDAADEKYQAAKKNLEALHADERDAHTRLGGASARVKELEKKIREEEKRIEDANGGGHAEKKQELEEAKHTVEELQIQLDTAKKGVPDLKGRLDALHREIADQSKAVDVKRSEVMSAENKLHDLEGGRGSPYDAYDPQLPRLLHAIEQDVSFQQKPIGPIGSHIQLLEPSWSSILESTLGSNLNGFIVTNKRDQEKLRAMMERHQIRSDCPILISTGQGLNTEGKEPDADFNTILRVLKIDNQSVRDQLIINCSIEQVILIPERTKGEDVMFNGAAPRNVKACLCFHDTRRGYGLHLSNRGAQGNIGTSTIHPSDRAKPRMKTNVEYQISMQREILQQLENELRGLDGERRKLQQTKQHLQAEISRQDKEVKALDKKMRDAAVTVDQVEDELDAFESADGRLQAYREELLLAATEREHHGNQYGNIVIKKEAQNKEVEALRKDLKAERDQMKDYDARVHKAEDKVKRYQSTRNISLAAKNEAYANLDMLRDDRQRAVERRQKQEQTVAQFTEQATQVCQNRVYIGEGETFEIVKRRFDEVTKKIAEREKEAGMTDEQIHARAIDAKAAYDECMRSSASAKAVCQELKNTLVRRLAKWRMFQRHISAASRVNFVYLLSERGFRGRLDLDHEQRKLTLRVEPDETKKSAAGRNTKTLSGGEKSFSSICLLLSIWEAMGSPLRCLDEFDVFMDNVNRAISTNMLITAARRSVSRQYILITPNAIEGRATLDRDVKIIRLTDPRQRTLADH